MSKDGEALHRDGWALVPRVVDETCLQRVTSQLERVYEQQRRI